MSSVTCPQTGGVSTDTVATGERPLNVHETADQILDLLKVAVFLALAVLLRHSMSDADVEIDSVVPGYQTPLETEPGNSRLLDLSTV